MKKLLLLVLLTSTFLVTAQIDKCTSGDCENGKGTFVYGNGSYQGDWKNGKHNGKGTYKWVESGTIYTGDWVDGEMTGSGILTATSKKSQYYSDIYEGQFLNGFKEGKGKQTWGYEKNTYEGNWKKGNPNGTGVFIYFKGTDSSNFESYEGSFKDGLFDGFGTHKVGRLSKTAYYNEIRIYEGNFSNGKYSGYGEMTYQEHSKNNEILSDASKYKGNWVNGYRDGKGKSYSGTHLWYDGDFKEDERSGTGTLYDSNGDVTKGKWNKSVLIETLEYSNSNAGKFTGKLKDGKKYGKGQFYLQDGTIIEGNFVDDKLDGKGKITYLGSGGDVYEGEIKDYKASGYGKTMYCPCGLTKKDNYHQGNYLNGLKHGTGAYVQTTGQTFEGEWSNGIQMSGKYYQQGKLIFEGNPEDYIAFSNKNEADFKKYLAERRTIINAENEAKKKAEQIRQRNMTEEEKLIEKYPCSFCGATGTISCVGGGKSTDVKVNNKTYGNLTITEVVETTKTSPSLQCPCNWCNGKKYLKL